MKTAGKLIGSQQGSMQDLALIANSINVCLCCNSNILHYECSLVLTLLKCIFYLTIYLFLVVICLPICKLYFHQLLPLKTTEIQQTLNSA